MRIGIDVMGGDYAPDECIKGIALLLKDLPTNDEIFAFGKQEVITQLLEENKISDNRIQIIHCPDVIEMAESPTKAFATKPGSSIVVGFQYLKDEKIDCFSSAGNSGAMLVGTMYTVKAIPGVLRPAISTVVPHFDGSVGLLLDIGANADCKPEVLNQFAELGSLYMKYMYKIDNPRVGLLNIGEEEGKGNNLSQAVYPMLKENPAIHFVGNVEGRDIFNNICDVIVCDGFTGNIVLKFGESFYDMIKLRKVADPYFDVFNYENYGGSGIIGVNAPVVIGHGISKANAIYSMAMLSINITKSNLVKILQSTFLEKQSLQNQKAD